MATVKEEVRRMIESLPDDATWEDVQYSIYVRERIERGRREAADGKILDEDEVERRMKPWLTEEPGRNRPGRNLKQQPSISRVTPRISLLL